MNGSFKRKMLSGRAATGCWLALYSATATEVLAFAGFDCVVIDCEHGPGSALDIPPLLHALRGCATEAVVRVPSLDEAAIKRALDLGVAGVMVPNVRSAKEAAEAAALCRYPPEGRRGLAHGIVRAADYGLSRDGFLERANAEVVTICQIESQAALDSIDEIVATKGVDMVFVGPNDLSADLGFPGEMGHPEVDKALAAVQAAAKSAGTLCGTIPTTSLSAEALYRLGYDLVVGAADVLLLRDAAMMAAGTLRRAADEARG